MTPRSTILSSIFSFYFPSSITTLSRADISVKLFITGEQNAI